MLVFENDDVEVVAFMLDVASNATPEMDIRLGAEELRRAETFTFERDRRRYLASRLQLRRMLAAKLGSSPSDIEFEYGRQGKPRLSCRMRARGLRFSLARSGDIAVVALSSGREIGVDVEAVVPVPEASEIAALCLAKSEYRSFIDLCPEEKLAGFLQRWTRLEAISKSLGCGLGQPTVWDDRDWTIRSFVPKRGYIGSVAVRN